MKRPSIFVHVAGLPFIGACLVMLSAIGVVGCVFGPLPWWIGLLSASLGMQAIAAMRERKAYKQWQAQWQAMGSQQNTGAAPSKDGAGRWLLGIVAFGLVLAIPNFVAGKSASPELLGVSVLWIISILYAMWILPRFLWRSLRSRGKTSRGRKATQNRSIAVSCLLPCAKSSPSRREAQEALPAYAARLLLGPAQKLAERAKS